MVSGAHPLGQCSAGVPARLEKSVPVDSFAGTVEVRWAPEEAVPHKALPDFGARWTIGSSLRAEVLPAVGSA